MASEKLKLHLMLKELLANNEISARQLSKETEIPPSTISSMMAGKGQHRPEQIAAIARYFGCSMEFLCFGTNSHEQTFSEAALENVFEGWLKVKIERAIPAKKKL